MEHEVVGPTCYEILQVHPAAPLDLITAAYWRLVDRLQSARSSNQLAAASLHRLTKAYQTLADPGSRPAYDLSVGLAPEGLIPRLPARRRQSSWLWRFLHAHRHTTSPAGDTGVNYYEVLRVDARAEPSILAVAHAVMRDYYLRLVRLGDAPPELLDVLEEAYAVTSNPARRQRYDAERTKRVPPPSQHRCPAPPTKGAPVERPAAKTQEIALRRPRPPGRQTGITAALARPVRRIAPWAGVCIRSLLRSLRGLAAMAAVVLGRLLRPLAPRVGRSLRSVSKAGLKLLRVAILKSLKLATRGGSTAIALLKESAQELAVMLGTRYPWSRPKPGLEEEEPLLRRLSLAVTQASSPTPETDTSRESEPVARLVVTAGPATAGPFALNNRPLVLGSDEDSDIVLTGIAARQARLWYREGRFMIHSLANSPMTLINGRPVVWAVLEDGRLLSIGPYRLRFDVITN